MGRRALQGFAVLVLLATIAIAVSMQGEPPRRIASYPGPSAIDNRLGLPILIGVVGGVIAAILLLVSRRRALSS